MLTWLAFPAFHWLKLVNFPLAAVLLRAFFPLPWIQVIVTESIVYSCARAD